MRRKWTWKNVELPEQLTERLALRFETGLLEAALSPLSRGAGEPAAPAEDVSHREVELLAELGELLSRQGDLERGLRVDETLVRIRPQEPIFHYNLACSRSQLGHLEPALEALERAIELGYSNFEHLRRDRDLDNLKGHERFRRLLEQFEAGA